jgi:hypothetical protein
MQQPTTLPRDRDSARNTTVSIRYCAHGTPSWSDR